MVKSEPRFNFSTNVIINLTGQFGLMGLTLLVNIIVARWLGVEGKGIYALYSMILTLFVLISNLGLGRASIYFIGKGTYPINRITGTVLLTYCLIGLTLFVLAVSGIRILLPLKSLEINSVSGLYLLFIAAFFLLLRLQSANLFAALHKFIWVNGLPVLDQVLRLIILAYGWLFVADANQDYLINAMVIGVCISTIIGLWGNYWNIPGIKLRLEMGILKNLLPYGLKAYSFSLTTFLNFRLDQFIIAFLLNISELGIYSVAVAIIEICMKISRSFAMVLFPKITEMQSQSADKLSTLTMRIMTLISLLFSIVLLIFGKLIIQLMFGDEFLGAYIPMILLIPGILMFNNLQIANTALESRGKPEIGAYATLVGIVLSIVGNFWLTPKYGISGAALVSTIAYSAGAIIALIAFHQESHISFREMLFPRRSDVVLIIDKVAKIIR